MNAEAEEGVQLDVESHRFTSELRSFRTYAVKVVFVPGVILPHSSERVLLVQD